MYLLNSVFKFCVIFLYSVGFDWNVWDLFFEGLVILVFLVLGLSGLVFIVFNIMLDFDLLVFCIVYLFFCNLMFFLYFFLWDIVCDKMFFFLFFIGLFSFLFISFVVLMYVMLWKILLYFFWSFFLKLFM